MGALVPIVLLAGVVVLLIVVGIAAAFAWETVAILRERRRVNRLLDRLDRRFGDWEDVGTKAEGP